MGIADLGWASGIGLMVLLAFGAICHRSLVSYLTLLCLGVWSIRLSYHVLRYRVYRRPEDGRYQAMRQHWGPRANLHFIWFFAAQAVAVVVFAAPPIAAMAGGEASGSLLTAILGVLIWIVSWVGESVADHQLEAFRSHPQHRGKVCRSGLWRYSRHPNYFFEWLHWWTYVLLGWGSEWWWITWIGPVVMLFSLFKVSGIPYTEQQALRSRGDAYRDYQRTTSVFIPWPPKKEA
jgi:steroid 5-alpha reductase family enzyme